MGAKFLHLADFHPFDSRIPPFRQRVSPFWARVFTSLRTGCGHYDPGLSPFWHRVFAILIAEYRHDHTGSTQKGNLTSNGKSMYAMEESVMGPEQLVVIQLKLGSAVSKLKFRISRLLHYGQPYVLYWGRGHVLCEVSLCRQIWKQAYRLRQTTKYTNKRHHNTSTGCSVVP